MDPRIQMQIHAKISWIRNTGLWMDKFLQLVQVTVVFNDTEPLYEIPTSLSVVFFIMYITIVLLGRVTSSPLFTFSYFLYMD